MNRRKFLKQSAALVAAVVVPIPAFPLPTVAAAHVNPLLRGELGRWEGVRITLDDIDRMAAWARQHAIPVRADGNYLVMVGSLGARRKRKRKKQ